MNERLPFVFVYADGATEAHLVDNCVDGVPPSGWELVTQPARPATANFVTGEVTLPRDARRTLFLRQRRDHFRDGGRHIWFFQEAT